MIAKLQSWFNRYALVLALLTAIGFIMITVGQYNQSYPFLTGNDNYRDYTTVNTFLLNGRLIPHPFGYHDRPLLFYFITTIHQLTGITIFDLFHLVIPLIFSTAVGSFYLFYQQIFKKRAVALTGAVLTIFCQSYFFELVDARPNLFALVILPLLLYSYSRVILLGPRWPNLVLVSVLMLAAHLTHPLGSLMFILTLLSLVLAGFIRWRKYWLWFLIIGLLGIGLFLLFGRGSLAFNSFFAFYQLLQTNDTTGYTLRELFDILGIYYCLIISAGLVLLVLDVSRRRPGSAKLLLAMLPAVLLFIFNLFLTWIGPMFGFSTDLLSRLPVYLWCGGIVFALYYIWRLNQPSIAVLVLSGCLLITSLFNPTNTGINTAYIVGREPEILDYIDTKPIENSIIITQATNGALFSLSDQQHNNIVLTSRIFSNVNSDMLIDQNRKVALLFNRIFFAQSDQQANAAIKRLLKLYNLPSTKKVYLVYSYVKFYNQYLWQNPGFRKQSLHNARVDIFNSSAYFKSIWSNGEIQMWSWKYK